MERIMVLFPEDLLREVDVQAKRLGRKRSQIVRQALSDWVQARQREEFEALLAQGYQEMAEQSAAVIAEFEPLQAEAVEGMWRWDD
jgi:metal-responsive CopG/Arc/MetJ family transcriptional regulator